MALNKSKSIVIFSLFFIADECVFCGGTQQNKVNELTGFLHDHKSEYKILFETIPLHLEVLEVFTSEEKKIPIMYCVEHNKLRTLKDWVRRTASSRVFKSSSSLQTFIACLLLQFYTVCSTEDG